MERGMIRINHCRRAVSLIELTVSMSVMIMLMGGLVSAVVIASRAIPDPQSATAATRDGYLTVDQIASDLFCATSFSETTATAMEFTVPDRGHDPAGDELIRYAWSGTPGDPLTYEYNGGAAVDLIPEVFEFNLAYGATTVMEEVPGEPTESGQVLFAILTTGTGLTSGSVTSSRWYGEYIHPAGFNSTPLPGDVVSWSIDVIGFRARQSGYAVGHTLLRVYAATPDGKPDTTALLAEATVNESDLPVPPAYFTLWSVPFHGSIIGLSPDQGICFTLTTEDAYPSLETQYYTGPLAMPDCGMLVSTDAGASWAVSATAGLRFSLYGKYVTLGEPQEVSSSYSTNIHISLRAGDRPGSRVDTSVTIPNGPKVTVP